MGGDLLAVVFGAYEMVDPDGEPGDADGTARPVPLGAVQDGRDRRYGRPVRYSESLVEASKDDEVSASVDRLYHTVQPTARRARFLRAEPTR